MPVDLAEPLGDERLQRRRLAEGVEHGIGDVRDRDVDAGRDVQHLARDVLERRGDHGLDRLGVVVDVEPVAARMTVAVDRQLAGPAAPA